jgi:hypothetical protein
MIPVNSISPIFAALFAALIVSACPLYATVNPWLGAAQVQPLTIKQKEVFLKEGKVTRTRGTSRGITGVRRATLEKDGFTHDASIQTIDESKAIFQGAQGTEINFRDTYKFNIAAYRLGQLLGLDNISPSVERSYDGHSGSFTWWIDDFLMDELDRMKKKLSPPDVERWNKQMYIVRVFDQLIYNVDRNLGNLLIDKNWKIWMIDHTRSFRRQSQLKDVRNLAKCDRVLLDRLKKLNKEQLKAEVGQWLTDIEIDGVLARRTKIVDFFEKQGPETLYDYLPR